MPCGWQRGWDESRHWRKRCSEHSWRDEPTGLDLRRGLAHRPAMAHHFCTRVYYEDTDLAGIVYYANYLKFIERARTEWVRSLGVDQGALKRDQGIVFAVRRVEADYIIPARFDEVLTVETQVTTATGARLVLSQDVLRDDTVLFRAMVTLVALTDEGKPARLPANIRRTLTATIG